MEHVDSPLLQERAGKGRNWRTAKGDAPSPLPCSSSGSYDVSLRDQRVRLPRSLLVFLLPSPEPSVQGRPADPQPQVRRVRAELPDHLLDVAPAEGAKVQLHL